MTERYVTEDEFLASLAAEEEAPTPRVVFVAPKPSDRGYHIRRTRVMEFNRRQTDVQTQAARVQLKMEKVKDSDPDAAAALLAQLDGIMDTAAALIQEQVEFLLPYVKAVKYPEGEGWRFWPRPTADGEERERFEAEARALLKDASEEEFQAMLKAAQGVGQAQVPPTNGGKSETSSPATA